MQKEVKDNQINKIILNDDTVEIDALICYAILPIE